MSSRTISDTSELRGINKRWDVRSSPVLPTYHPHRRRDAGTDGKDEPAIRLTTGHYQEMRMRPAYKLINNLRNYKQAFNDGDYF